MKVKIPSPGMLVQSLQGRDKGELYIVVNSEPGYVYLSNGTTKPIESPKKKNLKHVRLINKNVSDMGLDRPWGKSFNVKAAYIIKTLTAQRP